MRYPEHEVHSDRVGRSWGLLGGFTMVDPVDLKLSSSIAPRRTISLSKIRSEQTPSTNLSVHRGSVLASHQAALGLNPGLRRYFFLA